MESYTAFLDCRFLVGDSALAEEFQQEIFHGMIEANRRRFLQALVDMKTTRYKQFGDTIFQLEPDIKEAPGGLARYSLVGLGSEISGFSARTADAARCPRFSSSDTKFSPLQCRP